MRIGYARTSILDQVAGLDAQERDRRAAGCGRIATEQVSSVDMVARVKLTEVLDHLRDGDVLVVTKLDRLARSVTHLLEVLAQTEAKGAYLSILAMGIGTAMPTGRLMLQVLKAVGEFERSIMLERQREGIAKAKAAGKYKGRAPTAKAKADQIRAFRAAGKTRLAIAKELGVSERSVYRVLADEETTRPRPASRPPRGPLGHRQAPAEDAPCGPVAGLWRAEAGSRVDTQRQGRSRAVQSLCGGTPRV